MVNFLSTWVKNLSLAVVIISILEMLLPNNKTKKYVKVVMGLYILFSIISPFVENSNIINVNNLDFNTLIEQQTETTSSIEINQTSMDKRLKEIYQEQLEIDIKQKVEEKGYDVEECKVNANISDDMDNADIQKIEIYVKKKKEVIIENSTENEQNNNSEMIEEKLISEIQKIPKINIDISNNKNSVQKQTNTNKQENLDITSIDKKIIKDFLIKEYGVSQKCLKIN